MGGCEKNNEMISEGVERCPFLRNIGEPTLFNFTSFVPLKFPNPLRGSRGPIFEDGPGFDNAFRMFHGKDGVIPLSQKNSSPGDSAADAPKMDFNPLAASAATISLSAFGPGAYNFDAFMAKRKQADELQQQKKREKSPESNKPKEKLVHEALGSEWLATGNCPIAKSCRAVSGVLPLVAKFFKPPAGTKFRCPQAIVAARAALSRTAFAKNLRPRPLSSKVLAIGLLGLATNVPLGVWREHTRKFSPEWFVAVHAAVPFIAMMRKAIHMPKYAMAFTIAASILGQVIGSRAERIRLAQLEIHSRAAVANVAPVQLEKKKKKPVAPVPGAEMIQAEAENGLVHPELGKDSSSGGFIRGTVDGDGSPVAAGERVEDDEESGSQQCGKLAWDESFSAPLSRPVTAF